LPNETVELQVFHVGGGIDDDETSPAHQPWQITADGSGSFQTTWLVPAAEDEGGATLEVTASGNISSLIAKAVFTDTVSSVSINSPTTGSPVSVPAGCNVTI